MLLLHISETKKRSNQAYENILSEFLVETPTAHTRRYQVMKDRNNPLVKQSVVGLAQ